MTWMQIPGASRYEVSDKGAVRRSVRIYRTPPGPVSVSLNSGGYPSVSITGDDGKSRKLSVHALVMLAFVGPRPCGAVVCHWDGDRTNNRLENLRYDTPLSNMADARRHGTISLGEDHTPSKLTEREVLAIHARCKKNEDHEPIAADYGVTKATVSDIARGRSWRHLGLPSIKYVRKLSDADVVEAGRLLAGGMTKSAIARKFGVSAQAIHYAITHRLRHPERAGLFETRRLAGSERAA